MKRSRSKTKNHGTQEWAVKNINCCTGCSHDCLYCYAKSMAIKFKQLTATQWPLERIRMHDVNKNHKKYPGRVMFPSSHDITPTNLDACMTVLTNLFEAGNQVLIVSKPHLDCIRAICDEFEFYRDILDVQRTFYHKHDEPEESIRFRMVFRFTIGACDDRILSFWEPNAPTYKERIAALFYAYKAGYQTSVSIEPMLDSANIDTLISELLPYVTNSIWIGKMNHLGRFGKNSDMLLRQAINNIKRGQCDAIIESIYERHRDNPLIRWKKEIKKVVGIPVPRQNGLDI